MKLYEITNDVKSFYNLIEQMEEQEMSPDEVRQAELFLSNYRDEIKSHLVEKIESICCGLKNLQSNSEQLSEEIDRLRARKKSIDNQIDRVKIYMQQCLDYVNISKVDTTLFKVTIANNPPALSITDESKIPPEYLIAQPPKINNMAIKQAIKDGADYDWCELVQSRSIRIK